MEAGEQQAIEADGLTKHYDDTVAIEDLDLRISRGTIYGLLGPNGAGKSTTIRLLTSLMEPTNGRGWIVGKSIRERSAVKGHIGYLPEEPPLYDELTGREQLEHVADLQNVPADERTTRIEHLLAEFDLTGDAGDRLDAYSKGMRQKVSFIQSILHDPEVLFLDEPTSGLDPRAARSIRDRITDLAEAGTTIFLSTHILPVVDDIADEVGVLHEGRLVAEGSPELLKHRVERDEGGTLEDAFLEVTSDESDPEPVLDGSESGSR